MLTSYNRPVRRRRFPRAALAAVVPLLLVLLVAQSCRAVPALSATPLPPPAATASEGAPLPWPATGAAALATLEGGFVGSSNDEIPRPLASVTKVMTALVVLDGHPLRPGESGPTITITYDDVVEYLREAGEDQSVVPVQEGDQLSLLQLLQGLLVPSGNNIADLLARWDAGSMDAFVAKMNAKAVALGMTKTRYADASGISPGSVGTAADQVRLGLAAMQHPVLAQIFATQTAELPFAGTLKSTNELLGTRDVVGIKTGHTDEAGGCLLFAATPTLGSERRLVVGAVLGATSREEAFEASARLVDAVPSTVRPQLVVASSAIVGTLAAPWGDQTEVRPAADVSLLLWPGAEVQTRTELLVPEAPVAPGDEVGAVTVEVGRQQVRVPVLAVSAVRKPGLLWRLLRR